MKKFLYTILAGGIAFTLAACGNTAGQEGSAGPNDSGTSQSAAVADQSGKAGAATGESTAGTAGTAGAEQNVSGAPVLVAVSMYYYENADDGKHLFDGKIRVPMLADESKEQYPLLDQRLQTDSQLALKEFQESAEQITEETRELYKEYGEIPNFGSTSERGVTVMRADEKIVSFFYPVYDFSSGAAHGMYGNGNATYDAQTGNLLTLQDVFTDLSGLDGIIKEELVRTYPDLSFIENLEKYDATIDESIYEGEYENYRYAYTWALSNEGVEFYFGPYELASYAEGAQDIVLSYDKYANILNPKYLPEKNKGTIGGMRGNLDYDGDGEADELDIVYQYSDDYQDVTGFTVRLKTSSGETSAEANDIWVMDTIDTYLVRTEDKRTYLYVQVPVENDFVRLIVFELTGGKVRLTGEELFTAAILNVDAVTGAKEYLLTDADHMYFGSRFDMIATFSGIRSYHVGRDGMPEPNGDPYRVTTDAVWGQIRSKAKIKCDIVDEKGNVVLAGETLKSGETFKILGTDGESYLDTRISDGRIARLHVTSMEYPGTIDGVSVEELFEELYYAG